MQTEARLFKALADDTRLRILALLLEGELCVCELIAALGLPQSTVSRHLAYLRNSGWVQDRRQGVWMYYQFAQPTGPLHQDLLDLLQHRQIEIPQARQDTLALQQLIEKQGTAACR